MSGWTNSTSKVPNPWSALAARPHLKLLRAAIPEPARYYDAQRTIVVRQGLLLEDERRYLWHEIVHADRRDQACTTDAAIERSVDREAAQRAMPLEVLEWAMGKALDWHELAGLVKLPEEWVRFRLSILHPAQRAILRRLTSSERETLAYDHA